MYVVAETLSLVSRTLACAAVSITVRLIILVWAAEVVWCPVVLIATWDTTRVPARWCSEKSRLPMLRLCSGCAATILLTLNRLSGWLLVRAHYCSAVEQSLSRLPPFVLGGQSPRARTRSLVRCLHTTTTGVCIPIGFLLT
jgi:hypothetical protein